MEFGGGRSVWIFGSNKVPYMKDLDWNIEVSLRLHRPANAHWAQSFGRMVVLGKFPRPRLGR